ncbi:unnamed protein product [Oppiella nova]|uniref:non-specific serine/threonine protein kinase n=1 Tax=Oppiella nova TaxID=334625 RepID=A0A7R9QI22_9ACAR|nr:unnamed protein product [Oppiella nova]CAG2166242.1 unnamed protein product [Oppiella nova]
MASGSQSYPQFESIKSIKLFHVFQDSIGYNILVVTDKDLVYGLGSNSWGSLGLGHELVVNTATIIPELCDKNIVQFCTGYDISMAINSSGQVYEWKEWVLYKPYKPTKVFGLEDQQVCQISCGCGRSLALTRTGSVYVWDHNIYRPNSTSPQRLHFYANESNVDNEYHIKSVFCGHFSRFAITDEGLVFSWGRNECYQLGHKVLCDYVWYDYTSYRARYASYRDTDSDNHYQEGVVFKPQLVANVTGIKSIATGSRATYWLRDDGFVYFCGQYNDQSGVQIMQNEPKLLDNIAGCQELRMIWANDEHKAIALINDRVVEIDGMNRVKQTDYKNLFDYCLHVYRVTPETIITPSQLHSDWTPISQYGNWGELGTGSFGTVYKMRYKGNRREYAIKRIPITGPDKTDLAQYLKELENLKRVRSQYCVLYLHSFYDLHYYYIVMELCSDSLQTILDKKREAFGRESGQPMGMVEAYISCQIFKEILKCMQYLHGLTPPVTHGDLYPANILTSRGFYLTCFDSHCNRSHFKICDFGLTTIRQHKSGRLGNLDYQAPEIGRGEHNHKADLYLMWNYHTSLITACRYTSGYNGSLINLTLHRHAGGCAGIRSLSYSSDNELVNKCMINVMFVLQSMSYYNWDHPKNPETLHWTDRRECSEVLETYKEWTLCNKCLLSGSYVVDAIESGNV